MAKVQKKSAAIDASQGTTGENTKSTGKKVSKTEQIIKLLHRKNGANITDMQKATGWQTHSVHGFLAGLRKRGLKIERVAIEGQKGTYHLHNASA